jgi:hypothetical protein
LFSFGGSEGDVAMEITFERVALCDEVWATPLTQLAKKYS